MNILIKFQLISALLLFGIGESKTVPLTARDIEQVITKRQPLITGTRNYMLKLNEGGKLSENRNAIVWEGTYNNTIAVAIKITWNETLFNREIAALEALNAIDDVNIESNKIPRVYFHGTVLMKYNAIAMSLFQTTLDYRFRLQRKHLSDFSILLIFKQAVEALKYINDNNVLHNDIKPENIFLRGSEVFISDFDLSTIGNQQLLGCTETFATSGLFAKRKLRIPMDDFESLVFSIWWIAGIRSGRPNGLVLHENVKKGTAYDKMMKRCKHFEDDDVRGAFEIICADEMLMKKNVPDYERVITILNNAIEKVTTKTGQRQFEWL